MRAVPVFVVLSTIIATASLVAPWEARAADATIAIDVSWTRPGVDAVLSPPAALRVGDQVTVDVTATGTSNSICQTGLTGPVSQALHIFSAEATSGATCVPWTFILPPTAAGTYEVNAAVTGSPIGDGVLRDVVSLTVEPGGTPRPFASN